MKFEELCRKINILHFPITFIYFFKFSYIIVEQHIFDHVVEKEHELYHLGGGSIAVVLEQDDDVVLDDDDA